MKPMMKNWNFKPTVAVLMPMVITALSMTMSCDFGLTDNDQDNELEKLPPLTTTGENTFGCLVNGEAFVVTNAYNLVAMYQQEVLFVGGENDFDDLSTHINILVEEPISEGQKFMLNSNTSPKGEYYLQGCFYSTTPNHVGTMEITYFDTTSYIISGTFAFQVFTDDNCGGDETINITDGRFDMQYIP